MKVRIKADVTGYEIGVVSKQINPMKGLLDPNQFKEEVENVIQKFTSLGGVFLKDILPTNDYEDMFKEGAVLGTPVPVAMGVGEVEAEVGDVLAGTVKVAVYIPMKAGS